MVVVCEGCGTRFNLPDAQVPARGARVRCSKCHHRFIVRPGDAGGAEGDSEAIVAEEDSPEQPAEASNASAEEQASLDNPEFLFDEPAGESDAEDEGEAAALGEEEPDADALAGNQTAIIEPVGPDMPQAGNELGQSDFATRDADPLGEADPATEDEEPLDQADLAAEEDGDLRGQAEFGAEDEEPLSQAVFGPIGGDDSPAYGETQLAESDPEPSAAEADEGADDEIFGDDEDEPSLPSLDSVSPGAVEPTGAGEGMTATDAMSASDALDSIPEADLAPDTDGDGRSDFGAADEMLGADADGFDAAIQEEIGGAGAAVDAPVEAEVVDADPLDDDWAPGEEEDPLSSWDDLLEGEDPSHGGERPEATPPAPAARVDARPAAPDMPAEITPRFSGAMVERGSRILAVAAGLLLIVGGLRALSPHSLGPAPGPAVVRGGGWAAEQVDAIQLRDAAGRRVVVVRGTLSSPATRTVPPVVTALLLDDAGEPLGQPVTAHLVRLSGSELTPAALSRRLKGAPLGATGLAEGFTVLFPEPPIGARRYELRLVPSS